ncbi:hypothetical protein F4803DRAFT_285796 [Xylaria telfairii]|nr:hypothetical protein F4803DRAFT_285796 [Xylaria telfairii]
MPKHKTSISYLLSLAIPLASAIPSAGHSGSDNTTSALTGLSRVHNATIPVVHEIKIHGAPSREHKIAHHDVLAHEDAHNALNKNHDATNKDRDTADKTHGFSHQRVATGSSTKKRRGHTDSQGVTYDDNGAVTNIPLGAATPIYMPFGGVYDVPGWNTWSTASALDGDVVMGRAMALSVATTLTVYWIL